MFRITRKSSIEVVKVVGILEFILLLNHHPFWGTCEALEVSSECNSQKTHDVPQSLDALRNSFSSASCIWSIPVVNEQCCIVANDAVAAYSQTGALDSKSSKDFFSKLKVK